MCTHTKKNNTSNLVVMPLLMLCPVLLCMVIASITLAGLDIGGGGAAGAMTAERHSISGAKNHPHVAMTNFLRLNFKSKCKLLSGENFIV